MRPSKIVLLICATLAIAAYAPVTVARDVGKEKKELAAAPQVYAPSSLITYEPAIHSLTEPVMQELPADRTCTIHDAACVSGENCSKPLSGLAIRSCSRPRIDIIHLLVLSASGHRLIHVDPGLC